MNDYYTPHFAIEIHLQGVWHPVAWFVVLEDACLFHGWLRAKYPKEKYRIAFL